MKVAIITGASRGIGRSLALKMAKENFVVVSMARNENDLVSLENEITQKGGIARSMPLDISSEVQVNKAIKNIVDEFGQIDVLINNAGFGIFKNADLLTGDEWSQVMDVNAKGTFLLSKAVIPFMKKAGKGHIIGVATDVSKRVIAEGSLYCASKYAQDAFLGALRKEVRKDNIKVSIVYPGLVDTHFHGKSEGDKTQTEFLKSSDVADAVVYIVNAPAHVVIDELMIHPISQDY